MFIQIIEGRTSDAAALKRQMETWNVELRPGATGHLGSTSGVTADGMFIAFARFESEAAARANSDRPEQGRWWAETENLFDGDVTFTETTDVQELLGGGSNDAGFVQVMRVRGVDREVVERLDREFERLAPTVRPDLIGSVRVWTGPDETLDVNYFTSEADARAAESAEPPAEVADLLEEFRELVATAEYIDLPDPWLY